MILQCSARSFFGLLAAFAATVVTGCGESLLVPVNGVVTYNGEPVKQGHIVFSPMGSGQGRAGVARTDKNGTFIATTNQEGDGLMVGEYRVAITAYKLGPDGGVPPDAPGAGDAALAVPKRYTELETSGLTLHVLKADAGKQTRFDLSD